MTEDFLHFVWKYKNFDVQALQTVDGEAVQVLKAGEHNTHAGPDFLNGQVIIGDTHWAGNIELHLKTSDWQAHKHSNDPAYDNVILHVVYQHDLSETIPANRPLVVLQPYISDNTIQQYDRLQAQHQVIPCETGINRVDGFVKNNWLERMLAERLEYKANNIKMVLDRNKNDWAETAYQLTGRNFGFKVNALPFEALTQGLAHKILAKHKNNIHQIEALLYGQAGFLSELFTDAYPAGLRKEYKFLAGKYNLTPGRKSEWRFLRMRPPNFPTIRISQFAALIHKSEHLFSKILEVKDIKAALQFFDVATSAYWTEHYTFETPAETKISGRMGKESQYNLIINTVAPLLFAYGHIKNEGKYKETAMQLLEDCPKEVNNITKSSALLGFDNEHAYHSQALIHLRNEYCIKQRCLDCAIGAALLKN